MSANARRVVVTSRPTEYEALLRRHGTRPQAEFLLQNRGHRLSALEERHAKQRDALGLVLAAIPLTWRRAQVERADLSRFVFGPEDVVVAVGQDGLVANVAKYLSGQCVLGVNPDPCSYDGVLVRHRAGDVVELLARLEGGACAVEHRTMVEVTLDDGQRLLALNEVFLGHRSHQSARYGLRLRDAAARHSSSGLIVATGTGGTGWARSIQRERRDAPSPPAPCERRLVFFVREAFPSVNTETTLIQGLLAAEDPLEVASEMNEGGVIFGDGIEADFLAFDWGARARVGLAPERLALVV
jgi:hypothetical protein